MKWISVKDKKPRSSETLWACNEKYYTGFVCIYDENLNLFLAQGLPVSVTHYTYLKETVFYCRKPKKETITVKFEKEKQALKKKRKYTKRKVTEVTNEAGA